MFSYDSKDPSFRSSTNQDINNLLGSFGSNIADPVHLSLGMSYIVIILILFIDPTALVDDVLYFKVVASSFVYPSFSGWEGNTNENVVLPIPVIT